MIKTACAICDSYKDFDVLYKKNFSEPDLNTSVFSARRLPDGSHFQIVKCKKDGLVRSNPIIEKSKLAKLYMESKFTYEEEVENLTDTYISSLKPVLEKISKQDNILEIGCGNGFILSRLQKMGFKNCFGIEPSKDAYDKADKEIKKNILVDILRPDIYKGKKFKLIFFFQTLDHIPDPGEFLEICYGILEKKGYILAFNHNVESLSAKVLGERSPIIDIEHTYLYSPKTIEKLFKKYNFHPIKIYSPLNTISFKHLLWLIPFPKSIKKSLITIFGRINFTLKLKLGNLCIISSK